MIFGYKLPKGTKATFSYGADELFSQKSFRNKLIGIPFKDEKGNIKGKVVDVEFYDGKEVRFIVEITEDWE